jgi:hypothetical protein
VLERLVTMGRFRITRDLTMFMLGAGAFTFETLNGGDRPNVLYAALALMGVAAYLHGISTIKPPGSKD